MIFTLVWEEIMDCLRCGIGVESFSKMRKWCFDCRKKVAVEQARKRKLAKI